MRKLLNVGIAVAAIQAGSFAQVINTGSVLSPGSFSLSVAPILLVERGNDLGLFLAGGLGVTRGVDVAFKLRLQEGRNYYGGDVEFSVLRGMPSISLAAGAHAYNDVGLDGTLNITFPLRGTVSLYTGVDGDIEFQEDDQYFPLWIPVGLEVRLRRSLAIVMEIDIAVTREAESMFATGLNIFF